MTPTLFDAMFEINVAIVMVAVTFALFIWFQRSEAVASAGRLTGIMTRVGLDPRIANDANPQIKATMNEVRRRCARCPHEGFCERWLAGEVEGPNTFCPNASIFRDLAGTAGWALSEENRSNRRGTDPSVGG